MAETPFTKDLRKLTSKAAIYGLGMVLLRGMNFLLLPLYTRVLTTGDYGIIAVTTTVTTLLSIVLPMGLDNALVKSFFSAKSDNERAEGIWTIWSSMLVVSLSLTALLDLIRAQFLPHLLPNVPPIMVQLAIWSAFFQTQIQFLYYLLRNEERAGKYVLMTLVCTVTAVSCVVYFVVVEKLGAFGYVLGTTLSSGVCAFGATIFTLRRARLRFRLASLSPLLAYGLPLIPHSAAGWFLEFSDRMLLTRLVPLSEVGVYSVGYQIGTILAVIAAGTNSAWVPFLFKRIEQEGDGAKPGLARLATYHALGVTSIAVGLILFAPHIVRMLAAPSFASASYIVPWVVIGHLCCALYNVPSNLLFARGRTWLIPVATIVSGTANVALNIVLIPRFGAIAAAWTTAASYAGMLAIVWWCARFVYPLPYEYRRLGIIFGAAAAVVGIAAFLPNTVPAVDMVLRALLCVSFVGVLVLAGFLSEGERHRLKMLWRSVSGASRRSRAEKARPEVIDYNTIADALGEMEQRFPVNEWSCEGIPAWPLLRARIHWCASLPAHFQTRRERLRTRFSQVQREFRMLAKEAKARLFERSKNDKSEGRREVVFFSDPAGFIDLGGSNYERFLDPIEQHFRARGVDVLKLSAHEPWLPRHSPSALIGLRMRLMRAINSLECRLSGPRTQSGREFEEFAQFTRQKLGVTIRWSDVEHQCRLVQRYSRYFEAILSRLQTRLVFLVAYYNSEGFALCHASRRLGITAIDVQHGVQGHVHAAYCQWRVSPPEGYSVLPERFVVWSDEDAGAIRRWSDRCAPHHAPITTGNLFLNLCQAGRLQAMSRLSDRLRGHAKPEALQVLYTATFVDTPASLQQIKAMIRSTMKSEQPIQWWIRLHPAGRDQLGRMRQQFHDVGIPPEQVDLATLIPLYAVLPCMDVHVTEYSSTIIEADAFGVPSVATHVSGAKLFPAQIASGAVLHEPNFTDILRPLLAQAGRRRRDDIQTQARRRLDQAHRALDALLESARPDRLPVAERAA